MSCGFYRRQDGNVTRFCAVRLSFDGILTGKMVFPPCFGQLSAHEHMVKSHGGVRRGLRLNLPGVKHDYEDPKQLQSSE